ncbi:hypothetical protein LZK55_31615, partial [Pseudomonas aeruginosa]|nr:hypothetical protein [Pseudomonas aeruginosa]
MRLADIRHWVFDMDGTLTRAVHDFPAIRRALDIPEQDDILLHLAALPEAEAAAKHVLARLLCVHRHNTDLELLGKNFIPLHASSLGNAGVC